MKIIDKEYFKVYRELLELFDGDLNLSAFAGYILDCYPILRKTKVIDGEVYKRLSDDFIIGYIEISSNTIRKYLKKLEEVGFLTVAKATDSKRSHRYIKLDVEVVGKDVVTPVEEIVVKPVVKNCVQSNLSNLSTYSNECDSVAKVKESTSVNETTISSNEEKKDCLYSDALTASDKPVNVHLCIKGCADEVYKDILLKWYDTAGRGFTWNIIKDKLDDITEKCDGDVYLVKSAINNSYLNNYKSFYPPKQEKKEEKYIGVSKSVPINDFEDRSEWKWI